MPADFDFESRLVPLLLAYAQSRGIDVGPLISRYALPADAATTRGHLVTTVTTMRALADEVAMQLGDGHLGLAMAAWIPKGAYGVAEFLMHAGPTMRAVLENLIRFSGLVAPSQRFLVEEKDGEVLVHHGPPQQAGAIGRHLEEYSSAILIRSAAQMTGGKPLRAWFVHQRPMTMDFERLVQGLGTPNVSWAEATNGFSIDARSLDAPVTEANQPLSTFLEDLASQALAARPKRDDLIDTVRVHLREAIKHGEPTLERIAQKMNLSGRTLQRRLGELKSSFQDLIDEVRFDLARTWLKDPRLDVTQVAFLLGYSELRAFDRAFRRWANMSPSEWRG